MLYYNGVRTPGMIVPLEMTNAWALISTGVNLNFTFRWRLICFQQGRGVFEIDRTAHAHAVTGKPIGASIRARKDSCLERQGIA